jgi:hypothetical protein
MNELRRSAAVVAAALLVSVALWRAHAQSVPERRAAAPVTWAPAAAAPPPGYHYVVGASQIRDHLLGRQFSYGVRRDRVARLVAWRRGGGGGRTEWWPTYRLSENCRWISSPDPRTVCDPIDVPNAGPALTRSALWNWHTGGPRLPGMSPTYTWRDVLGAIGGSAGSVYHHVTRPCTAGRLAGLAGGVVLSGLAPSLADDGAVVGAAVVQGAGGPAAAGVMVDGCVVAVLRKNV